MRWRKLRERLRRAARGEGALRVKCWGWKHSLSLHAGVFTSFCLIISVTYHSFLSVRCCRWTAHNPLFMDLIWLVTNAYGVSTASSSWWWGHCLRSSWASREHPPCCIFESLLFQPAFKAVSALTFLHEILCVYFWKDHGQLSELQPSVCTQRWSN